MTCPCGSNLPARLDAIGHPYCPACQASRRLHGKPKPTDLPHSREFVTRQAKARAVLECRRDSREAQS